MLLVATLLLALPAAAQQPPSIDRTPPCTEPRYGIGGVGSRCLVGIRASFNDHGHRHVSGMDLSVVNRNPFVDPADSSSIVNGITLSLFGADAAELNGLNAGLAYAQGTRAIRGINVGGLGAGSDSIVQGITVAGLFVAGKRITGVNVAGLAVAGDRVRGINVAGVGTFGKEISGLNLGFGVAGGRVSGVSAAGWLVHGGDGGIAGIHASLVGVGASGAVRGIAAAGVGVFAKRDVTGLAAALGVVDARELTGVAVGAHTRVRGTQRGLTVGLLNRAHRLQGVQLGFLNEARNNPALLRWVPGVNVHL